MKQWLFLIVYLANNVTAKEIKMIRVSSQLQHHLAVDKRKIISESKAQKTYLRQGVLPNEFIGRSMSESIGLPHGISLHSSGELKLMK